MTFRRPRQFVLAGGCNLRDLGGHGTADGRDVVRGLLYRSAQKELLASLRTPLKCLG